MPESHMPDDAVEAPVEFSLDAAAQEVAGEDAGIVVALRDKRGRPYVVPGTQKPVTIRIAGSYSTRFRRAKEAQTQRLIDRARRGKNNANDVERANLETLAVCILSWDGIPLELSVTNAMHVLTSMPWVREQLQEAQGDHEGFSLDSSKS